MRKIVLFLAAITSLFLTSCNKEDWLEELPPNDHTMIVFMPWSSNLQSTFVENIKDLERAVENYQLKSCRVVVAMSTSPTETELFEMSYYRGQAIRDKLITYPHADFTSEAAITTLLNDIKNTVPAPRYSLIIGSHGLGWLPVSATANSRSVRCSVMHYEQTEGPQTRWFGGITPEYQIDVTTLAKAIADASMHMEYILFDDCYMSSVEVAYDLKDVTDYLIACPTEIMKYGFPYYQCTPYLTGTVNYTELCNTFLSFYSSYSVPCGTIAVTDCRELDGLAAIVRDINSNYTFDKNRIAALQTMDGYTPTMFFDFGDYISRLCEDNSLKEQFRKQMEKVVPYKAHTPMYYSAVDNSYRTITAYSGLTTSEPSLSRFTTDHPQTAWYQATHKKKDNNQETTK